MSSEEREERAATSDQEGDASETAEGTELDERRAVHEEESLELPSAGELSDSENESDSLSKEKPKGDNVDEPNCSSLSKVKVATASDGGKASGRNNKRKTRSRKKASSQEDRDNMNESWDDSNSQSEDEPELLQSTDSDSDKEHSSNEPRTLERLGITLDRSDRIWRSHKSLLSREIGMASSPCLFTRDVAGSINMVKKFRLERKLEYHAGCVNTLNFNTAGDLLASGSDDLNVALWDWSGGKKKFHYESGHTGNVFQAKFMPNTNDSIVVTCARDGQVRAGYLSSFGSCNRTKRLAQHRDGAHKLSIEPGSPNILLTCGEDGQVIEIDLRMDNGYRRLLCRGEENIRISLYSIFINPAKHEEFAVGGRDKRCRIYDRRHMKEDIKEKVQVVKEYCPSDIKNKDSYINVTCLVYSHDGSELLVSYNDEDIYLFNTNFSSDAEHIHKYKGHRNNITVKGVNFYGPRSEFIVSGSDCGHVFLWDKETESIVQLLEGDEAGVVNCLEPHPYHPYLATSGLDHDVKIWTPTSHEAVDFENIKSVVLANDRERDEEGRRPQYPFNGDLLMYMVNHIARRRHHATESDAEDGNGEEDTSSDEDGERVQCYPS